MKEVTPEQALAATDAWLRELVIGLNLCPFAAAPYRKNRVRLQVSTATESAGVLADLLAELHTLDRADPLEIATTLLILPYALADFYAYNEFLDTADAALVELDLEGVIQIASFHPDYQFADAAPQALSNYTNRSPYPLLHLIREEDIDRAVSLHPDVSRIPEDNIRRLESLGAAEVKALLAACQP